LVCDLDYPAGTPGGPPAVVAKVHSDDEGLRAHQAARSLLAAGFGTALARLALPIAYLPELKLSVQEHVPHEASYKDLFHAAFDDSAPAPTWEALVSATRTTATALARLHRTPVTLPVSAHWDDELSSVRAKHEKLARVTVLPAGTSVALERLASAARRTPADRPAPCHHSFRPAQVLLEGGGVCLIDLDKVCMSEPASDVALFTSKLRHMAANKTGTASAGGNGRVEEIRRELLATYATEASVHPHRVALWEGLELVSLVLSAAKKLNADWVATCSAMLTRHLDDSGL
jgi:aminoglycoside phosphotransferase (APT) family kinase protein